MNKRPLPCSGSMRTDRKTDLYQIDILETDRPTLKLVGTVIISQRKDLIRRTFPIIINHFVTKIVASQNN